MEISNLLKNKLTPWVVSVLIIVAGYAFIPGFIYIKTNPDFNISINSKETVYIKGDSSLRLVGRGNQTVTISKNGYRPIQKTISSFPLFYHQINETLQPKILKDDLSISNSLNVTDSVSVNFCDSFKNSACLKIINGDPEAYMQAKTKLNEMYSQDTKKLPVFMENTNNGNKSLVKSPKLSIYLINIDAIDKPVLFIRSGSEVSEGTIDQIINSSLDGIHYSYYTIYENNIFKHRNTTPKEVDFIWYDENEQFGVDYDS